VTAAKLLRATIREASYDMDSYPQCKTVEDIKQARNWMPDLLQTTSTNPILSRYFSWKLSGFFFMRMPLKQQIVSV